MRCGSSVSTSWATLTQKDLTGRLARWAEALADFNMTIEHIQGRDNPADVLSRPPAREPGPNAETGKEDHGDRRRQQP